MPTRPIRNALRDTAHSQTVGDNTKNMNSRLLIFCLIQALSLSKFYGQEGKLYTIIDQDTVSVESSGIEVFIVVNSDTLDFNKNEALNYPKIEKNNDVKSILVSVYGVKYEFFNKSKSNLPPAVLESMGPFYQSLFADKRNMYVTLKGKSDMFDDLPEGMITDNAQIQKQKAVGQITLYYQQKVTMSTKK